MAAAQKTATKICVAIKEKSQVCYNFTAISSRYQNLCVSICTFFQVQGAAFGLQTGCDALIISSDDEESWRAGVAAANEKSSCGSDSTSKTETVSEIFNVI